MKSARMTFWIVMTVVLVALSACGREPVPQPEPVEIPEEPEIELEPVVIPDTSKLEPVPGEDFYRDIAIGFISVNKRAEFPMPGLGTSFITYGGSIPFVYANATDADWSQPVAVVGYGSGLGSAEILGKGVEGIEGVTTSGFLMEFKLTGTIQIAPVCVLEVDIVEIMVELDVDHTVEGITISGQELLREVLSDKPDHVEFDLNGMPFEEIQLVNPAVVMDNQWWIEYFREPNSGCTAIMVDYNFNTHTATVTYRGEQVPPREEYIQDPGKYAP